jgi:hypothetical protein
LRVRFEILIPPEKPGGLAVTAKVEAESWMGALSAGVKALQLGVDVKHVVADLREDGSVLVTEPGSKRSFLVREVQVVVPQETAAIVAKPKAAPKPPPPPPVERDRAQEERLVQAFHRATRILNVATTPSDAANGFLDVALALIPAEAAAVLIADIAQQDMFIAFARGERTAALLNRRIPFGAGVAGHAVLYNIGLAVNDVTRDFRHAPDLPEALGLAPLGILCAPAEHQGRSFGALHLVNKQGANRRFTDADVQVLGYLAGRLAEFLDRYFMRVA